VAIQWLTSCFGRQKENLFFLEEIKNEGYLEFFGTDHAEEREEDRSGTRTKLVRVRYGVCIYLNYVFYWYVLFRHHVVDD